MVLLNTERMMAAAVQGLVKLAKYWRFDTWQPGEKLKILLIGYNGKRNAGADLRVVAMVDQFYHILGQENVEIGVLTLDVDSIQGYFSPSVRLEQFDPMNFYPVAKACSSYHMGVLSEGSCLKSTFANSLTLLFVGCAGAMKRQGKPCIAYGSEAGEMDPFVCRAAQRLCDETYFIARSQPSLDIIHGMGLQGDLGTDTAWMARAAPEAWARQELERQISWDGKRPLVGVAVINPFWWPVKADLGRYLSVGWKANRQHHYAGWYFFGDSDERRALLRRYLGGIARSVDGLAEKHRAHVAVFGMEAVDLDACLGLQSLLRTPSRVFCSTEYDGYQLTSLLRRTSILVTSRYHARVLLMPAGVPSIAVSMDERLYNLYAEGGHVEDYYLEAGDPLLEEKLSAALEKLWANRERVGAEIQGMIPGYLRTLAEMGSVFRGFVRAGFPQLLLCPEPADWLGYLAPLAPELRTLIEEARI